MVLVSGGNTSLPLASPEIVLSSVMAVTPAELGCYGLSLMVLAMPPRIILLHEETERSESESSEMLLLIAFIDKIRVLTLIVERVRSEV